MGLGVSVGMLYNMRRNDAEGLRHFQDAFAGLERALAGKGVQWREPPLADTEPEGLYFGQVSYSSLHHLRRVLVLVQQRAEVTPAAATSAEEYARDERMVKETMSMFSSHLVSHSDTGGYYVPLDFDWPLLLDEGISGGGMVGSSQQLLAELQVCAAALDIDPGRSVAPAAGDPFESEKLACHELYAAALASATTGHAIVFH